MLFGRGHISSKYSVCDYLWRTRATTSWGFRTGLAPCSIVWDWDTVDCSCDGVFGHQEAPGSSMMLPCVEAEVEANISRSPTSFLLTILSPSAPSFAYPIADHLLEPPAEAHSGWLQPLRGSSPSYPASSASVSPFFLSVPVIINTKHWEPSQTRQRYSKPSFRISRATSTKRSYAATSR